MIRRIQVARKIHAMKWKNGAAYAYRRGDKAGRELARRRAVRWGKRHDPAMRADAMDPIAAPLRPSSKWERVYAERIRRAVVARIRRALVDAFRPVLRGLTRADAPATAPKRDMLLGAVRSASAKLKIAGDPRVAIGDIGRAVAKESRAGTAKVVSALVDDPAERKQRIRQIDLAATEQRQAILDRWAREQAELITRITPSAMDRVSKVITKHVTEGTEVRTIARYIQETIDVSDGRAMLIARTEVAKLNSTVAADSMQRAGATMYIWRTSQDERVRGNPSGLYPNPSKTGRATSDHFDLDGTTQSFADPPVTNQATGARNNPGMDYQCLPGDAPIRFAPVVLRAFRHLHRGKLTTLVADSGEALDATPNHPVLTNRGWVAAQFVEVGDYVFSTQPDRVTVGEPAPEDREPTIEEVFDALASAFGVARTASPVVGFHGDTAPDQHVDVVSVDGGLTFDRVAAAVQQRRKEVLSEADAQGARARQTARHVIRDDAPARRLIGGGGESGPLGSITAGHPDAHGGAPISRRDSGPLNVGTDRGAGRAEVGRDRLDALTGAEAGEHLGDGDGLGVVRGPVRRDVDVAAGAEQLGQSVRVAADGLGVLMQGHPVLKRALRIVENRTREAEVHVFNLETDGGWYDSVLTVHNCRCTAEPVFDDPNEDDLDAQIRALYG